MRHLKLYFIALITIAGLLSGSSCKKPDETVQAIDIMVVSKWAYTNDTLIEADTAKLEMNRTMESGIVTGLYNQEDAGYWTGYCYDWDLVRKVDRTLFNDPKAFINLYEYFVVYSEVPGTNPDICTVTIELHKGKPYNKNSAAIYIGTAEAAMGEPASYGGTITSHYQACYEAAKRAANTLAQSGKLK